MTVLALVNAEILAGPLRVSGQSNEVMLDLEAKELDQTVFTSQGWREVAAGLKSAKVETKGFMLVAPAETGAVNPDAQLWSELGGGQVPVTVAPTGVDGSVAYVVPTRRGQIDLFGKVGELAPFGSSMWGDGATGRGALIHPATVVRTAGGTGNGVQLGTVAADHSLLVAIHVLTVTGTGPALTITVQRDDNVGFTTPTTVTTLGPVSAPTHALVPVAGPITPDDRYRITWTLTGTTPSARFAVAVGIT